MLERRSAVFITSAPVMVTGNAIHRYLDSIQMQNIQPGNLLFTQQTAVCQNTGIVIHSFFRQPLAYGKHSLETQQRFSSIPGYVNLFFLVRHHHLHKCVLNSVIHQPCPFMLTLETIRTGKVALHCGGNHHHEVLVGEHALIILEFAQCQFVHVFVNKKPCSFNASDTETSVSRASHASFGSFAKAPLIAL